MGLVRYAMTSSDTERSILEELPFAISRRKQKGRAIICAAFLFVINNSY